MSAPRPDLSDLHARLGYRRLNRTWAKAEILAGLGAAGAGLLAGAWAVSRTAVDAAVAAGGWGLFVLGSYLALAGHRSHLYQSGNERTAYLAEVIRGKEKVPPDEHPR
jgi:hypothetical protein